MSWGDGELRAPKRQHAAPANDVKGLFTDSVIAQMPVSDVALDEEESEQPITARMAQPGAGLWHEPTAEPQRPRILNSLRARSSPITASVKEAASRAASKPLDLPPPAGALAAPALTTPSEPFLRSRSAELPAREPPAGALSGPKQARGRVVTADVAPLAEAQGTRTIDFEPGPAERALELDTPAAPRASSLSPKLAQPGAGASMKPVVITTRETNSDPQPSVSRRPTGSLRPAAPVRRDSPAPAAAAAQLPRSKAPAGEDDGEVEKTPSGRPVTKHKRAEARRAARRAAAKHLPPPPAARRAGWDPARIILAAFSGVVAISAIVVGAATAGLITLPPAAAAMLGLDDARASLSQAKPRGKAPNLVMPTQPTQAAPEAQPAVVRLPDPPPTAAPAAAEPPVEPAAAAPAEGANPQPTAAEAAPASAPTAAAPPAAPAEAPAPQPTAAVAAPASAPTAAAPTAAASAPAPVAAPTAAVAPPEPVTPPPPTAAAEREPDRAAEAEPSPTADSAKLVRAARALLARDPPGAAEMMMAAIKADPDDHHAMEVLVRAWIAMGRGKDAVGYAEYMVKKRPKRAMYRLLQGDAKQLAGDRAGAEAAWRAVLALEPNDPEAKKRLGL